MNPKTERRAENGTFPQIQPLEEKRQDLLRRRQTAEDLRKHNLAAIRALEDAETDPEGDAQAIEDRFARDLHARGNPRSREAGTRRNPWRAAMEFDGHPGKIGMNHNEKAIHLGRGRRKKHSIHNAKVAGNRRNLRFHGGERGRSFGNASTESLRSGFFGFERTFNTHNHCQ